jgi:hypothetical protein
VLGALLMIASGLILLPSAVRDERRRRSLASASA